MSKTKLNAGEKVICAGLALFVVALIAFGVCGAFGYMMVGWMLSVLLGAAGMFACLAGYSLAPRAGSDDAANEIANSAIDKARRAA